ncbi:MAG: hypothetical protein RLZZ471_919 [Actinomycetota bacterium]|jgi:hypothetical protein
MYEYFAFVDESVAKKYRLCIVAIPANHLATTRSELQKLRLKGQSRIHMHTESDSRRIQILKSVVKIQEWRCLILEQPVRKSNFIEARKNLFIVASVHKLWGSIKHITIETSTEMQRDKKILTWIKNNTARDFEFAFASPAQDEGLWLADILAWSFARGGKHRNLIADRVELITSPV